MELKRQGQAMVEWVLILPVTLMLTFAVCQWCLFQLQQNMVTHAAWHAARAELVSEDPWDAAAIVLSPIAGFSDNLIVQDAAYINWQLPGETIGPDLPGWGEQSRARLLNDHRLQVSVIESDWNKVSAEVRFQAEMLFPFMEGFFADSQTRMASLNGGNVSGDTTHPGMAQMAQGALGPNYIKAVSFVELTARATIPRIDQPRAIWNLSPGNGQATFGAQVTGPPSPFPGRGSAPSPINKGP